MQRGQTGIGARRAVEAALLIPVERTVLRRDELQGQATRLAAVQDRRFEVRREGGELHEPPRVGGRHLLGKCDLIDRSDFPGDETLLPSLARVIAVANADRSSSSRAGSRRAGRSQA